MIKVLIVDDEDVVLKVLEELLKGEGYEVITAKSGGEGFEVYRTKRPDIVLLDKNLPDISGLEIAKRIKENAPYSIIIMITAYPSIESAKEAMKIGVFSYITKPFEKVDDIIKIMRKANRLVELKRQRERLMALTEEMKKRRQEI